MKTFRLLLKMWRLLDSSHWLDIMGDVRPGTVYRKATLRDVALGRCLYLEYYNKGTVVVAAVADR